MAKQVLRLDPDIELKFKGPFTDVVTSELKLTNPSDQKVCFKVKTTAPKRYCVRPNSGIIDPNQSVNVSVMLQPFDYDPLEKNKHKFMVQTMFAPDGPIESQEQLWKEAKPESLMDSKLKCLFEIPNDNNQTREETEKIKPVKQVQLETSQTIKSSPESEGRKGESDKQRLQAEIEKLQDENKSLKDSEARLRKTALKETVSSTPSYTPTPETKQDLMSQITAFPNIVIIIAALIIGVILGKMLL
ncbi:vesicle-associated membrane protein-associated protein A-like [Mytilus galloprovincialis]|uniref:vesicle-associated membrane protein/synaptobrevin-binding protein-like n=1 Tax=Mytilus trossulus TaxID=6551 RepID=UPI003003D745